MPWLPFNISSCLTCISLRWYRSLSVYDWHHILQPLQWCHNEGDGVSNHQPHVFSTVYSDADQRNYQSSASLAFVRAIDRWPVTSPHKCPVPRKMFSFDYVFMFYLSLSAIWDRNSVIPLPAEILLPDGSKPSTVTILISPNWTYDFDFGEQVIHFQGAGGIL